MNFESDSIDTALRNATPDLYSSMDLEREREGNKKRQIFVNSFIYSLSAQSVDRMSHSAKIKIVQIKYSSTFNNESDNNNEIPRNKFDEF